MSQENNPVLDPKFVEQLQSMIDSDPELKAEFQKLEAQTQLTGKELIIEFIKGMKPANKRQLALLLTTVGVAGGAKLYLGMSAGAALKAALLPAALVGLAAGGIVALGCAFVNKPHVALACKERLTPKAEPVETSKQATDVA